MRKAANIWRRQGTSAAHLFAKQDLYEKAQNGNLSPPSGEIKIRSKNYEKEFGHFDDRDRVFRELLDRGVLIRVVGPDGWMRVCMGTDEEMARFREALAEVLRIVEA